MFSTVMLYIYHRGTIMEYPIHHWPINRLQLCLCSVKKVQFVFEIQFKIIL